MVMWKFNPENYNEKGYQLIPPDKYRVRIEDAVETQSKKGKDMIKMTLKVSGYNGNIWYYMVFDDSSEEAVKRTDDRLGRIFDSFEIPAGDFDLANWKGKVGAANIKNEEDQNGKMRAAVSYFLRRKDQDILPPWQEEPLSRINPEGVKFEDGEIPF